MTRYVTKFVIKAEQIAEVDIVIQDNLLSIMLLSSLPTEYQNFIIAMEFRNVFASLESLKYKLIEEEARQNRSAKCNTDNNMLLSKNRSDRKQTKASGSAH